jgi:hypothetical protein
MRPESSLAYRTWVVYVRTKDTEPLMVEVKRHARARTGIETLREYAHLTERYDVTLLPAPPERRREA